MLAFDDVASAEALDDAEPSKEYRAEAHEARPAVECSRYSRESITAAEALLVKLR